MLDNPALGMPLDSAMQDWRNKIHSEDLLPMSRLLMGPNECNVLESVLNMLSAKFHSLIKS